MNDVRAILEMLWRELGDPARPMPAANLEGTVGGLPSAYAVSAFAAAAVGVATASVAELVSAPSFAVNAEHAAAAFRSERYISPIGWQLPPIWDPIAGDYRAKDGWVRVHTNYTYHRDAALRALGCECARDDVARAIAERTAEDVETAVVREGGAAAMLRTAAAWAEHAHGRALAAEPLFASTQSGGARPRARSAKAPLAGVRVLDLTRVIAGPVCTRFLAAYGADVLRIDPPEFAEVGALLPETTAGKRRAALDLKTDEGRATFLRLAADADLLVCGYRASALERLVPDVRAVNPSLGIVLLDAYGWRGPWRDRRGFDSLVQMSTGIAWNGDGPPKPLPAQALDHGAGYLLAAAACRALTERNRAEVATTTRLSLARVAKFLVDLGTNGDSSSAEVDPEPWRERAESAYGPLLRVRCPGGVIDGFTPRWTIPAGPLGIDAPKWQT